MFKDIEGVHSNCWTIKKNLWNEKKNLWAKIFCSICYSAVNAQALKLTEATTPVTQYMLSLHIQFKFTSCKRKKNSKDWRLIQQKKNSPAREHFTILRTCTVKLNWLCVSLLIQLGCCLSVLTWTWSCDLQMTQYRASYCAFKTGLTTLLINMADRLIYACLQINFAKNLSKTTSVSLLLIDLINYTRLLCLRLRPEVSRTSVN